MSVIDVALNQANKITLTLKMHQGIRVQVNRPAYVEQRQGFQMCQDTLTSRGAEHLGIAHQYFPVIGGEAAVLGLGLRGLDHSELQVLAA